MNTRIIIFRVMGPGAPGQPGAYHFHLRARSLMPPHPRGWIRSERGAKEKRGKRKEERDRKRETERETITETTLNKGYRRSAPPGSRRWPPLGGLKMGGLFKALVEGAQRQRKKERMKERKRNRERERMTKRKAPDAYSVQTKKEQIEESEKRNSVRKRHAEREHPQQRLISPTPHLPPKGGIWACELF